MTSVRIHIRGLAPESELGSIYILNIGKSFQIDTYEMDVMNLTIDTKTEYGVATVATTYGGSREGQAEYTAAIAQNRSQTKGTEGLKVFQPCVIL